MRSSNLYAISLTIAILSACGGGGGGKKNTTVPLEDVVPTSSNEGIPAVDTTGNTVPGLGEDSDDTGTTVGSDVSVPATIEEALPALLTFRDAAECKPYEKLTTDVVKLDVTEKGIASLEFLVCFPNLEELEAPYNDVRELKGLEHAKKLRELNLRGNALEDISILSALASLETAILSLNSIRKVSGAEFSSNIKYLDISSNLLDKRSIEILENLKIDYLHIAGNLDN